MLIADLIFARLYVKASKKFHDSMLGSVLRCKVQYFEATPIGRILNRFSKDIDACETKIPEFLRFFIRTALNVVSVVVVISIKKPFFLILFAGISVVYIVVQVI